MKYIIKQHVILKFISLIALGLMISATQAVASFYPNNGDIYYDGEYYLDAYLKWQSPGSWSAADSTYEHDLTIDNSTFLGSCTSFTNLPDGYDDCPTSGWSDPSGETFSFGSFSANAIAANTWYAGAWFFFTHGAATSSGFDIAGQEAENNCPPGIKHVWCIGLNPSTSRWKVLLDNWYLNWQGYPSYTSYYAP